MDQAGFNHHDPAPPTDWSLKTVGRHVLGIVLLLCVVIIWTLQNFMISNILVDDSYAKPFFLNYSNTSGFIFMFTPSIVRTIRQELKSGTLRSTVHSFSWKRSIKKFVTGRETTSPAASQRLERSALLRHDNFNYSTLSASASLHTAHKVISDEDDSADKYFDTILTARLSLCFCLTWFAANYFGVAALQYTTVSSQSIISSTSSIWCLIIGALTGIEKFTWRKLCGTLFVFCGMFINSSLNFTSSGMTDEPDSIIDLPPPLSFLLTFPTQSPTNLALGDILALLGAISYGFYTVSLVRATEMAHPRSLHMPTFFGFVGLFNMILLFPLIPIFHYTGFESFALPSDPQTWSVLFLNAFASFISDPLWAHAMVLTGPLVCTVGLSLTIPTSLFIETVVLGDVRGVWSWVGGMVVVLGFVFVEREEVQEEVERVELARSLEQSLIFGVDLDEGEGGEGGEGDLERGAKGQGFAESSDGKKGMEVAVRDVLEGIDSDSNSGSGNRGTGS